MADAPDTAAKSAKPKVEKPEKPDEAAFNAEVEAAQKDLDKTKAKLADVRSKLDLVQTKNKDSPHTQKVTALKEELDEIRKKQGSKKDSRKKIQDQMSRLDERVKSLISEQNKERGKTPFKSIEDVDREISRLQKQVDTGTMKLVDEKKALSDITGLNRQRKSFAGFATSQKQIDELKAQISELKKSLDDPENKALNSRYDVIKAELDELHKASDEVYKNKNSLRDERNVLTKEQSVGFDKIKAIKDKYFQAKREYHGWEQDQKKARRDKYLAEKTAYETAKKHEIAARKLEDAAAPAYYEELVTANNLIRFFDPSALITKTETESSKYAAGASRTVDDASFKGMRVVKRDDDDYFVGAGKKKKGKKAPVTSASPAEPSNKKWFLTTDIIEQLSKLGLEPPLAQASVPETVTKIQEKVAFWKKDQDRKTKENVEKAKKDLDRIEATETAEEAAETNGKEETHAEEAVEA